MLELAPDAGLEASSPRRRSPRGVKLHLIAVEESPHWAQMLRDQNLTSHTYNANLPDEIIGRLTKDYVQCFRSTLARLRAGEPAS